MGNQQARAAQPSAVTENGSRKDTLISEDAVTDCSEISRVEYDSSPPLDELQQMIDDVENSAPARSSVSPDSALHLAASGASSQRQPPRKKPPRKHLANADCQSPTSLTEEEIEFPEQVITHSHAATPWSAAESMDYQETKRIQEDIDEMFSYLNGWLDEPESETTELLSVSGMCQPEHETELDRRSGSDSQSDDSAVCVGADLAEHSRSPTSSNSPAPELDSEDSVSPTSEPGLSDSVDLQEPTMVDPLIMPIVAPRPLLPSRNVDISSLNYIQLQFPELSPGNNKENWDVKDDPLPSDHDSLTDREKLRTCDPLHVLYSQISKNKPKRSSSSSVRDDNGGRMQRIREQSPVGMRSPCFEPHFRQEEEVYATPYGCSEVEALYTEPHVTTVHKMTEGSIVHSLYPLSSSMPGTLSFMSGETGVLMRTNIGGWCYICMRDKEGWAPANYWQPLRSALRERMRARSSVERNEFLDDWYLGPISRPDSEFLLVQFGQEGDFLLRNSSIRVGEFTLSMRHRKQVHHFAIRRLPETGKFTIGSVNYQFNSLNSIIAHYRQHTILSDKYAVLRQAFAVQL